MPTLPPQQPLFYGLIRALMTEDERFRFVAVAMGLVVVLAFVYWRFIHSGEGAPP